MSEIYEVILPIIEACRIKIQRKIKVQELVANFKVYRRSALKALKRREEND